MASAVAGSEAPPGGAVRAVGVKFCEVMCVVASEEPDQMNAVVMLSIIVFLVLGICMARSYVNPDGGLCRYPGVARLFKACRH